MARPRAPPPSRRGASVLPLLLLALLSIGAVVGFSFTARTPAVAARRRQLQRCRPTAAITAAGAAAAGAEAEAKPHRSNSNSDAQAAAAADARLVRVQTMDYTTLLRVGGELRRRLLPGRVENAVQPDDYSLMLQIRSLGGLDWLLLSWHPEAARVSLLRPTRSAQQYKDGGGGAKQKKRGGGGPGGSGGPNSAFYSLPGQIRAHLHMRTLVGVRLPLPGERVLVLDFAERVTDAGRPTHRIYVEVMGRRSNIMLVGCGDGGSGGGEEVLACGYQVSPTKSVRPVSVGQPYVLPPPLTVPMPPLPPPETPEEIEAYAAEFTRRVALVPAHALPKALMSAYRGLSPQLVQAMCEDPTVASTAVEALPPDFLPRFFRGPFLAWLRVLAAEQQAQETAAATQLPTTAAATPTTDHDNDAASSSLLPPGGLSWDGEGYTPLVFEGGQQEQQWRPVASVLELVDRYYTSRLEARELLDLRRRGLAKVQQALGRLKRTRDEFARRLEAAGEASLGELQATAELLTTYAYSWKEGDDACLCYAMDTGAEIRIPLPPGKSAADEAQALYARVRKLRRSVDAVKPLLEKVEVKIAYVEELEASLLQLANGAGGAAASSPSTTAAATTTAPATDEIGERGDWSVLVSQDLAVMRELAEELGLGSPSGSGSGSGNAPTGNSFFATILQRLSYPGVGEEGGEDGGGGGKGRGGTGGGKQGKGKGGGKQQGGGKGKKQANSINSGGGKQAAKSAPAVQSYPVPASDADSGGAALRALVGRNSRQNDHVTFALAKPHELWFHAQGVPGAHVLLRFDPGAEVSDGAMQFAADLAAHFSKARGAKEVPVMYTSPKNLKRIVGGGPGMVQVSKEKIIWGRPSEGEAIARRQAAAAAAGGTGDGKM